MKDWQKTMLLSLVYLVFISIVNPTVMVVSGSFGLTFIAVALWTLTVWGVIHLSLKAWKYSKLIDKN